MEKEKRLIDANALLRHKRKMSGADFGGEFWDEAVLVSDIENAPTVDAVEVVRCKDCRHYEYLGFTENPHEEWYECSLGILNKKRHEKDSDAFCSYGERRKNG